MKITHAGGAPRELLGIRYLLITSQLIIYSEREFIVNEEMLDIIKKEFLHLRLLVSPRVYSSSL